ncbi:TPA: TraR/DksA C4-type zinc finger protein [Enterobacter asburiae]
MADLVDEAEQLIAHRMEVRLMAIRNEINKPVRVAENCESCDQPIGEARRKILPGTTLCVHCKTVDETLGKHIYR